MKDTQPSIKINDLSVEISGQMLFDGLNAEILHGEKVLITGKSGSGKSTLLKCLLGFAPVKSGSITFKNISLNSRSVWHIRKKICYVPQEPIFHDTTILEIIKLPFSYKANSSIKWDDNKLNEMLDEFGLPKTILEKKSDELSGGEKQRVAIICALLLQRDYLFMDEPTSALDDSARASFIQIIRKYQDLTVLMVSHDKRNSEMTNKIIDIDGYTKVETK